VGGLGNNSSRPTALPVAVVATNSISSMSTLRVAAKGRKQPVATLSPDRQLLGQHRPVSLDRPLSPPEQSVNRPEKRCRNGPSTATSGQSYRADGHNSRSIARGRSLCIMIEQLLLFGVLFQAFTDLGVGGQIHRRFAVSVLHSDIRTLAEQQLNHRSVAV
jgi:hypothetical protein